MTTTDTLALPVPAELLQAKLYLKFATLLNVPVIMLPLAGLVPDQLPLAVQLAGEFAALQVMVVFFPITTEAGLALMVTTGATTGGIAALLTPALPENATIKANIITEKISERLERMLARFKNLVSACFNFWLTWDMLIIVIWQVGYVK